MRRPLWYDDMTPEQQKAYDEREALDLENEVWWIRFANWTYHRQGSRMSDKGYQPHTAPVSIIRESRKYGAR